MTLDPRRILPFRTGCSFPFARMKINCQKSAMTGLGRRAHPSRSGGNPSETAYRGGLIHTTTLSRLDVGGGFAYLFWHDAG